MGVWNQLNTKYPNTGFAFSDVATAKEQLRDEGNWELLKGGTADTGPEGMAKSCLRAGLGWILGEVFHPKGGRALSRLPREVGSTEPDRPQEEF